MFYQNFCDIESNILPSQGALSMWKVEYIFFPIKYWLQTAIRSFVDVQMT